MQIKSKGGPLTAYWNTTSLCTKPFQTYGLKQLVLKTISDNTGEDVNYNLQTGILLPVYAVKPSLFSKPHIYLFTLCLLEFSSSLADCTLGSGADQVNICG